MLYFFELFLPGSFVAVAVLSVFVHVIALADHRGRTLALFPPKPAKNIVTGDLIYIGKSIFLGLSLAGALDWSDKSTLAWTVLFSAFMSYIKKRDDYADAELREGQREGALGD